MKRLVSGLLAVTMLSGCASNYSQENLLRTQQACAAGDDYSCRAVPGAAAQVEHERNTSGAIAAVGILGILAGAAVGAAASSGSNNYYIVRRCRWC